MNNFTYKGKNTNEISFPLGGIGSGCIGLAGNGRLIDWEIFNKPNKGSANGFSHFAVKVESKDKVLDARILNGDLHAPYTGAYSANHYNSYGFGPNRETMAGLPHFKEVEFQGEYPLAALKFIDDSFPGGVVLKAFNPLIPLNDKDSSIPGAFFEIEIENTQNEPLTYTICSSLNNPLPKGATVNTFNKVKIVSMINLNSTNLSKEDVGFGDMTMATDAIDVSHQEYWYRGNWFDNLGTFWRDFTSIGKLKNRIYSKVYEGDVSSNNFNSDLCSMAVHLYLLPNEKKTARFVITWSFPNCTNYWNIEKCNCSSCDCETDKPKTWKNYYTSLFENSKSSALYSMVNWDRLYKDTLSFKNALFSSTLPETAIDAISANIATLKSPTCIRLEDGSFYGFEGCHCDEGCCEGSCTHVWNYAYALPFLFPKLERSMRDLDYKYNMREDGGMPFRLQLPIGREKSSFRPCVDGQFGGVLKSYRDWKISGDSEWLKSNWEDIKKSIDFAWAESNEDMWDKDKDGVLEGRQHHTLDMELFGPSSWLNGFYLAALKAGAEMAEYFGEKEKSEEYMNLFKRGKNFVDNKMFNGEYYQQLIDLKDKSIVDKFNKGGSLIGVTTEQAYWNDEAKEIKYQIGDGSVVDQVVAQWHANIIGLGEIFDKAQTKMALQSIYKYNFKKSMRGFFNPCRIFALNAESAVIICDWPEGKYKPVVPVPYAEEAMNGFEYQVAIHMIQEGLVKEGMEIVVAIRNRYDGEKRNPWNEFECGSNYARSMASYALLNAFSGFEFDMVKGIIGFNPVRYINKEFKCFWSIDSGWGTFSISKNRVELNVIYGELNINKLNLPFLKGNEVKQASIDNKIFVFKNLSGEITFDLFMTIKKDFSLVLAI